MPMTQKSSVGSAKTYIGTYLTRIMGIMRVCVLMLQPRLPLPLEQAFNLMNRAGGDDVLTYSDLAAAIGVERRNFRRTIQKDARFQEALQERGLEETEIGARGQKGLRTYVSPFPVEDGSDVYTDAPGWDF